MSIGGYAHRLIVKSLNKGLLKQNKKTKKQHQNNKTNKQSNKRKPNT